MKGWKIAYEGVEDGVRRDGRWGVKEWKMGCGEVGDGGARDIVLRT